MAFKINIGDKGKTWKLELESEYLVGKSLGDKIQGVELKQDLDGYEFEIGGGSDIAGFPLYKEVEGIGLKKVLLKKGFSMKDNVRGIKKRKTVRGKTISAQVVQVNLKILKHGKKNLVDIFPDQNKPKEQATKQQEQQKEIEVAA